MRVLRWRLRPEVDVVEARSVRSSVAAEEAKGSRDPSDVRECTVLLQAPTREPQVVQELVAPQQSHLQALQVEVLTSR